MSKQELSEFLRFMKSVKGISLDLDHYYKSFRRWKKKQDDNRHLYSAIDIIANIFLVTSDAVFSPSRGRKHVDARHCAFFILKKRFGMSYSAIGRLFGNRDHTTIMHGVSAHMDKYKYDEAYQMNADLAMSRINKLMSEVYQNECQ